MFLKHLLKGVDRNSSSLQERFFFPFFNSSHQTCKQTTHDISHELLHSLKLTENRPNPKRKLVFQPPFFRKKTRWLRFREGNACFLAKKSFRNCRSYGSKPWCEGLLPNLYFPFCPTLASIVDAFAITRTLANRNSAPMTLEGMAEAMVCNKTNMLYM